MQKVQKVQRGQRVQRKTGTTEGKGEMRRKNDMYFSVKHCVSSAQLCVTNRLLLGLIPEVIYGQFRY